MRSFRQKPTSDRRSTYLALAGSIESQLREAYAELHEQGLETQAGLATKLGVNKSVINRRLKGASNMTIETIADMVWALGRYIEVKMYARSDRPEQNNFIGGIRPNIPTQSEGISGALRNDDRSIYPIGGILGQNVPDQIGMAPFKSPSVSRKPTRPFALPVTTGQPEYQIQNIAQNLDAFLPVSTR